MADGRKLYSEDESSIPRIRGLVDEKLKELRDADNEERMLAIESYKVMCVAMEGIDDCKRKPPTKDEFGTVTIGKASMHETKVVCKQPDDYLLNGEHYTLSEVCELIANKIAKIEKEMGHEFRI